MLDAPWDRWAVFLFLHPAQQALVDRTYGGPARAAGSAGTGKTVVALHRAARLAREATGGRVLLTTFSPPLAGALSRKLALLAGDDPAILRRVTVAPYRAVADELHQLAFGRRAVVASDAQVEDAVAKAAATVGAQGGAQGFTPRFLLSEWRHVVDAWQIADVTAYACVPRLGRKNRMSAGQRERLWPVFAAVRASLGKRGLATWPEIFGRAAAYYAGREDKPFTHIVVDEAQDLGVAELRFLAAVAPASPDALFFADDGVLIGTIHLAKGLEFKAAAVMACDDDVLPLRSRLEAVADETELDDVYETEPHLFYVACTRARDRLLISAVRPASEFIQDL